jgi:hypothetical protein
LFAETRFEKMELGITGYEVSMAGCAVTMPDVLEHADRKARKGIMKMINFSFISIKFNYSPLKIAWQVLICRVL